MDEEVYYLDTPAVPAVQQVVVKPSVWEDVGKIIHDQVLTYTMAYASEVKDNEGEIEGSVVWFPGQSFEDLIDVPVIGTSDDNGYAVAEEDEDDSVEVADLKKKLNTYASCNAEIVDANHRLSNLVHEKDQEITRLKEKIAQLESELDEEY